MQAPCRWRVDLERAAPGARAVCALTLLGPARPRAQGMQLESGDLGRPAGRDVDAGVHHLVPRAALQLTNRVEEVRTHDPAAERVARPLGGVVESRVGDPEPGQEG